MMTKDPEPIGAPSEGTGDADPARPVATGPIGKVRKILVEDTSGIHPRLQTVRWLDRWLPRRVGRAALLRTAGISVGTTSWLADVPRLNGPRSLRGNLRIGNEVTIERGCTFDLEDTIIIEDRVAIGPQVMILTATHELGPKDGRAGSVIRKPVRVGAGAWVGARTVILPGVTIGAGAIVAPGSLVNKDVPADVRVAGNPAKVVEDL